MALDPNEKKSQSVRRGLILLLIGLQLMTVLLILFIAYFSISRDVNKLASHLLDSALNESKQYVKSFLKSGYRLIKFNEQLFTAEAFSSEKNVEQWERHFFAQLKANPEIISIYFAGKQGSFYSLSRDISGGQSSFVARIIKSDAPGVVQLIYRDDRFELLASNQDQEEASPFQQQTWYQKAISREQLIWTDPQYSQSLDYQKITAATPIYDGNGDLIGVTGVDIKLDGLLNLLADLGISKSISSFVISSSGNVLISPHIQKDTQALSLDDASPKDRKKSIIDQFLQLSDTSDNGSLMESLYYNDQFYNLKYIPIDVPGNLDWTVGAYVSQDGLIAQIRRDGNRNVLIALLILAVSLAIGWVLIRRTWQPFERFFHDVITDQLTGLFNRRFLENIGSRMYIRLLRSQHNCISIAVIDLDFFQKINREFGRTVGNRVLKEFANFLKQTLRPEDIITRYSGDTFVVIFPGKDNQCAISVINRLRTKLDAWPLAIDDLLIRLTFSAGVETIDEQTKVPDAAFTDFIEVARKAMRKAKNKGRDRIISANVNNIQVEPKLSLDDNS